MSSNPVMRQRSFFTSEEVLTQEWNQVAIESEYLQGVPLYQVTVIKRGVVHKLVVSLMNKKLFKHKQNKVKWMDLENAYLDHQYTLEHGPALTIIKNNYEFTMYGNVEELFVELKQFTVQFNFQKHYSLIKKIGQGNFSDVYKAQCRDGFKQYAVKCISKSLSNLGNESYIKKEIAILRKLNSKSIVHIHEVFENDDYIYIVLDLMEGGDLHKAIKHSLPFSEESTQKIVKQLLEGVAVIHEHGLMHRDLKPQNILFRHKDCYDNICIADFGLAEYHNKEGKYQFTRCGTPGYVAPEILQDKIYDQKVDLYSVGIIMYQLLCGQPPFQAQDYDTIIIRNYAGIIDYSKIKLSPIGMDLLRGLLTCNPAIRLSASKALEHQWFEQQQLSKINQFKIKQISKKTIGSPYSKKTTPQLHHFDGTPTSPLSYLTPKVPKLEHGQSPPKSIALNQGAITMRRSNFRRI